MTDATPTEELDPLYPQAIEIVRSTRKASVSWVQRRMQIGYNRASLLVEQMERDGLVGAPQAGGSRSVMDSIDSWKPK